MLVPPVVLMMTMLVVVLIFTWKMVVSAMSHAINVNRARVSCWLVMRISHLATCTVRNLRVRHMTVLCFALVIQPRRFGFFYGANDKAAENSVKNYERDFAINGQRTIVCHFSADRDFFHVCHKYEQPPASERDEDEAESDEEEDQAAEKYVAAQRFGHSHNSHNCQKTGDYREAVS